MKALVIDDSRAMRSILRGILGQRGFDVAEAEHGRAGLQWIETQGNPELILVDWHMPTMTGIEFVHELRGQPSGRDVRIMVVSVETEMQRIGEALAAGADEYLMKPFDADALLDKLVLLGLGE